MGGFLQSVIGLFTGGAGAAVGGAVANVAAFAALAPAAYWFIANKDGIAVSLTWGQLGLFGLLCFFVVKIVHWTRSPGS